MNATEQVEGIAHWDEAAKAHGDYGQFRDRMTAEAVAACEGALAAGATEIVVRDAHGSGRNILQEQLPREAKLIRGWSGHPYAMVQELDSSYDAVCFVGYHGPASDEHNPLSHTNTTRWNKITLNGVDMPEYLSHAHCAALEGVPVVFVSGDAGICTIARDTNPQIRTVATNDGHGESVIGLMHPQIAREQIASGVQDALESDLSTHVKPQADHYELRVRYVKHGDAFKTSFFPGASLADSQTVVYSSEKWFDIATFLRFL